MLNTKAVEIQTNWPIRVSHGYKYSSAPAILRDDGMGKFGLESWVCQRRRVSPEAWEEDGALSQPWGRGASILVSSRARLKVDEEAHPGLTPVLQGRWPCHWRRGLWCHSVSIAFKKAECALLLPGGQWTIALFLKDWAGWWRRGGNKSDPASLGRRRAATSISGQPRRKSREAHFLPNRPQITVPVMCIF